MADYGTSYSIQATIREVNNGFIVSYQGENVFSTLKQALKFISEIYEENK